MIRMWGQERLSPTKYIMFKRFLITMGFVVMSGSKVFIYLKQYLFHMYLLTKRKVLRNVEIRLRYVQLRKIRKINIKCLPLFMQRIIVEIAEIQICSYYE